MPIAIKKNNNGVAGTQSDRPTLKVKKAIIAIDYTDYTKKKSKMNRKRICFYIFVRRRFEILFSFNFYLY